MIHFGFEQEGEAQSREALFAHAIREILRCYPQTLAQPRDLQQAASQLTDQGFDVTQWFSLLEAIYPPLLASLCEQGTGLLNAPLSTSHQFQQSRAMRQLLMQLAVAYLCLSVEDEPLLLSQTKEEHKRQATDDNAIVFSKTLEAITLTGGAQVIALSLHRALCLLIELQIYCGHLYHELPTRFWLNLHVIYVNIVHKKLERFLPPKEEDLRHALSLRDSYKRCLLLSLFNMSALQHAEINTLVALLPKWLAAVTVRSELNRADLYCFCLSMDHGPGYQSLVPASDFKQGEWLSLETDQLGEQLTQLLKQASQTAVGEITLEEQVLSERLLRHLEQALRGKPVRKFRRSKKETTSSVALQVTLLDQNTFEEQVSQTWQQTNSSAGGYCFTLPNAGPEVLGVGDLLRMQEKASAKAGSLGIIRWLNHDWQQQLQIGVQLLSPAATTCVASMGQHSFSVVYLPEVQPLLTKASVILPTALVKEGDVLTLPQGQVVLKRRREKGPVLSHYEIVMLGS